MRRIIRFTSVAITVVILAGDFTSFGATSGADRPTGQLANQPADQPMNYMVQLDREPAASYAGGIEGYPATRAIGAKTFAATSVAVRRYSAFLEAKSKQLADGVGATVDETYSLTFAGFAATLDGEQARALAAKEGVQSVEPTSMSRLQSSPIHYRGLSTGLGDGDGLGGLWEKLGGAARAGEDVVIGVIDGGISTAPEFFAGKRLSPDKEANPRADTVSTTDIGGRRHEERHVTFTRTDGRTFRGICPSSDDFEGELCSSKVLAAEAFDPPEWSGTLAAGEYNSARAATGHGPNVASIAAGNAASHVGNGRGTVAVGVAPAARLAIYKACWILFGETQPSCPTASVVSAIDAAVRGGVDVLNLSIVNTGSAEVGFDSSVSRALRGAAETGIFVAAAAGNTGPGASTITDNVAPWITTVANSTSPDLRNTLVIDGTDGSLRPQSYSYEGVSIAPEIFDSRPIAAASWVSHSGRSTNCRENSLDSDASGKIVVCIVGATRDRWGSRAIRLEARAEVERVGGAAVILVPSQKIGKTPIDSAGAIPTLLIDDTSIIRRLAGLVRQTVFARFTGGPKDVAPGDSPAPVIAEDSARGPIPVSDGDVLKPDVAALGTAEGGAGFEAQSKADPMTLREGTSQSTAIVSGLAALYLSSHPYALPGDIKSALMTTARSVRTASNTEETDVFAQGAGLVSGTDFLSPGLLYQNDSSDWQRFRRYLSPSVTGSFALPANPSDLNLASIQVGKLHGSETVNRRVTSTATGTWKATTSGLLGVSAVVEPDVLSFAEEGVVRDFTVTFRTTDATFEAYSTGYLSWTNTETGQVARSPIAVRPVGGLERTESEVFGATADGATTIAMRSATLGTSGPIASVLAEGRNLELPPPLPGNGPANRPSPLVYYYPRFTVQTGGFARFVVTGHSPGANDELRVQLLHVEPTGTRFVAESVSRDNSKTIEAFGLPEGEYALRIVAAADPGLIFSVAQYVAADPLRGPRLDVAPTAVTLLPGVESTLTVSWNGLTPGRSYVGYVFFGSRDWRTLVSITVPPGGPAPSISGITRTGLGFAAGTSAGGDSVTITGTGLGTTSVVRFGDVYADVLEVTADRILVLTPPHDPGVVNVTVAALGLAGTAFNAFEFGDPPTITTVSPGWALAGVGGSVAVGGTGFTDDLILTINGEEIADPTITRWSEGAEIEASAPAAAYGIHEITVTTRFGTATAPLRYVDYPGEGSP